MTYFDRPSLCTVYGRMQWYTDRKSYMSKSKSNIVQVVYLICVQANSA